MAKITAQVLTKKKWEKLPLIAKGFTPLLLIKLLYKFSQEGCTPEYKLYNRSGFDLKILLT